MSFLNKVQDKQIVELVSQQLVFDYQLVHYNYLKRDNTIIELVLMPTSAVMPHACGQYCKLMVIENEYRSYSIVNIPDHTGKIVVHIRIPKNPNFLLTKPVIGATIKILGPFGNCSYNFANKTPTIFLAEGIGIAAFYAMLEHENFKLENYLLIWLKNFYDTEYSLSRKQFWNKVAEKHTSVVARNTPEDYEVALEKCTNFISTNKNVRLYVAGSPALNNAITQVVKTFDNTFTIEVFSDI